MASVLCVVAHPDDEVLGCGGTLAKHAEEGDEVWILILSCRGLERQIRKAAKTIGSVPPRRVWTDYVDDQKFDIIPVSAISNAVRQYQRGIDIIYTHHPQDLNLDHALTARAVLTAFRPKPGEKPRTILACEVLSSTEYTYPRAFQPNWFVALTGEQLERKIEAMRCYETELCEWPHPRSILGIRNLAAVRGQESGVERAEAFQLLRRGPA